MKSFAVFLVAAALGAQAQTPDASTLPACGQTCLGNMVGKAGDFGCGKGSDYTCLCKAQDFIYGIRDCSMAACGNDGPKVTSFMKDTCKQHGVEVQALDGTNPSDAGQGGAGNANTSTAANTGSVTMVTATVTRDGSTYTTTYGPSGSSDANATHASSTSTGNEPETMTGNPEPSSTESGTDTTGAAPSETGEGGTARKTAAPLGILAAAGIAVFIS